MQAFERRPKSFTKFNATAMRKSDGRLLMFCVLKLNIVLRVVHYRFGMRLLILLTRGAPNTTA